jgi:hypothetical protein
MEKPAFTRACLSSIRVIMVIMHILLVEWDRFQHSSAYYQARVGAYGYVLSCQVLNGPASRGPDSGSGYSVLKPPG